jgi:hypothetical protein
LQRRQFPGELFRLLVVLAWLSANIRSLNLLIVPPTRRVE